MSVSSRRTSDKLIDRFTREFNLPHNGEKNKISHTRSTSRDSSKNVHLPLISTKNEKSTDAKYRFENNDQVANRDSKKKSIPKINDKHHQKLQPLQRRFENEGPDHEDLDNEDIEQYINNMNEKDVENLRKSIKDSNSNPSQKKTSAETIDKFKQLDQEFTRGRLATSNDEADGDEEIGHDSADEANKDKGSDFFYRPSFNQSNSGMRIKVVKTRPISGKVNDTTSISNYATLDGIPRGVKQISNLKSFESLGIKKDPTKKPFANRTNDVNYSDSETKASEFGKELPIKRKKDSNSFISHISPSKGSFFSHQSPSNKKLEPISARGAETLLKRIELLDEGKKNFLENILDQIEKGKADKEVLLGLEFLRLKKRNAKRMEKRKIIDAQKNIPEAHHVDQDKSLETDPSDKQLKLEEQKFLRENTNSTPQAAAIKKINNILENVDPQLPGEYRFGDEERQEYEKNLEKSFLRETKKEKDDSHDFSIDMSHKDPHRESIPLNIYSARTDGEILNRPAYNVNPFPNSSGMPNNSGFIGHKLKGVNEIDTLPTFEDAAEDHESPIKKRGATDAHATKNIDHPYEKQLLIRIISTWGDVNQAGLTKLQLFDDDGNQLLLGAYDFFIKHGGNHSVQTIERLIEGTPYTIDANEMWTCEMPNPPTTPELYINTKRHQIGAIRIWNYNKSLIDSVKGIKEVEIVSDEKLVWSGILNRAPGNDYDEYVTEILLKKDIYLPDLQTPQQRLTIKPHDLQTIDTESAPVSYRNAGIAPQAFQERPISGPTWGSHLLVHKFISADDVTTPTSTISNNTGHDRSLPLRGAMKASKEEHSKTIDAKVSGYDLQVEELRKKEELVKTKSAAKIKHPKVRDPIPLKKGEPTHSLASPFKHSNKELPTEPSTKKKDSNNSITSLEYFNITNFGRLKPARRESLQEVLSLKQDVEERIHNIEKLLDFKSTPLTEAELLSHLSKKTVSKQLNVIEESQELVEPPTSFRQALAEIEKIEITHPSSTTTASSNPTKPGTSKNSIPQYFDVKNFKIPELPSGRKLKFIIYSTWGDTYYLGLSGIELYDDKGAPIIIKNIKEQVVADPADINCLPGYGQDPRTIDKLFDGTYLTCDDLHVWLAPFTKGKDHWIEIDLKTVKTVSMIRIWNYNKSRIHSYRGVRDMSILLDGNCIFCGEIAKAPGSLKGAESGCEYIMFTSKEEILNKIEKDDWLNKIPKQDMKELDMSATNERPLTGTKRFDDDLIGDKSFKEEDRPLTMAKLAENANYKVTDSVLQGSSDHGSPETTIRKKKPLEAKSEYKFKAADKTKQTASIKCKKILINILDSWGDPFYVGLTGLEILDQDEKPIELKEDNLSAKPRDMNSIPGYSGDYRTLDKLINGTNQTIDDQNMWMIPFTKGQPHLLTFTFNEEKTISGIRFWNYNKSYEHSCRGARLVTISADNILVTPSTGVLVKKASGNDFHDFSQTLRLPFQDAWSQTTSKMYTELKPKPMNGFLIQDFDTPELPTGFTFKIVIHESWGDLDYVGLNGIEFYDHNGAPLLQSRKIDFTLCAEPGSVNVLKGSEDVRTVDKLVNGENDTMDDRNMWLAPLLNERRDALLYKSKNNEIYISFDKPVLLSCAKFWNYSKTLTRGAKELEIYCDDSLIYRGSIKKGASPEDIKKGMDNYSTVLFTKNGKLIDKIKANIYTENGEPQKVVYINEKKVMNKPAKGNNTSSQAITLERPSTSVRGPE